VLRYAPWDPNRLDGEDGFFEGIACTTYYYATYPNDRDYTPVGTITGIVTVTPTFAVATPTVATATPTPAAFDPRRYLGQGNRYGCLDFASHAQAQAVLRADPTDPNRLDTNPRDGLACGGMEASADGVAGGFMPPPFDGTRVPR
jgi:hypothetical protein